MFAHVSLQRCSIAACSTPAALTRPQAPGAAAAAAAVVRGWQQQPVHNLLPPPPRQRQQGLSLAQQRQQPQQQQRCTATAAGEALTSTSSIYDRPQLYDEAFSYRDFVTEAKFLMGAHARHSLPGGKLSTVLELGCGPANHALQLAQRGVQAWALDSNAAMLAYAGAKAAAAGVDSSLTTVQGDMADFQIQGMSGKFDLVVCMLGTLSHMLTNSQAAAAFRAAAQHLRPGGLLLLELAHPGDLFDGSLLLQDVGAELWEVERKAGPKLTVMWGTDVDDFDPETQVLQRTVSIHEGVGSAADELGPCLLEEVVPYRQFTLQEIDLLAILTGLQMVGVYGDLDLDVSLSHEDAFRMVVCLRKQGEGAADTPQQQ